MINGMGILSDLSRLTGLLAQPGESVASILTSQDSLNPVAVAPLDLTALSASRESALRIPSLLRARNLICTTAARMGYIATRDDVDLDEQPAFLTRTNGVLSPYHRVLWTADDLLFYGWSLWGVTRNNTGHVLTAERIPFDDWDFTADSRVQVLGREVSDDEVILIPGVHEGILAHGGTTIREANALALGVIRAVETPTPVTELHQTNERNMSQAEADLLKANWNNARRQPGGGTVVTSAGIEVKAHSFSAESLLVEGRNAVATDIARLCGIPSPMIDAYVNGTSMSYSNTESRMAELIAFGVAPIAAAIAARLGMDDVVPRGTAVRVDSSKAIESVTINLPDDDVHPSGVDVKPTSLTETSVTNA
ncbi:TPA: phage portal protein [Corynebacterium striatum]|nr:phage portal protein [Corynebacterium striatum]HAT6563675.1 phage portal protein [Corynebacterium striatum]HAT6569027.1 phage portal protein [Corynebacterium striatum]HAT6625298.1 phage portal protein [Corynebacterium striatum]